VWPFDYPPEADWSHFIFLIVLWDAKKDLHQNC
jgi:hypothetical protein